MRPPPAIESAPALRVREATKQFGATIALDAVSLDVPTGSVTALVGPNGSGKSTLIKALAGYHELDRGSIEVFGKPLNDASRDLRFVHQDLALLASLDLADNLATVHGYARGRFGTISWKREYERVRAILRQVSLDVDPRTPIAELGPVEQTLVAIARALDHVDVANNLLVLDEPTARLPSEQATALLRRLESLRAQGLSVIYVTHRLQEVYEIADRVVVFKDGRNVFAGVIDALPIDDLRALLAGPRRSLELAGAGGQATSAASDVVLELRGVSSERLSSVDLVIRKGELVGVTGLIGSGRSELGRVVYGLQRRDSGEILIEGKRDSFPVSHALYSSRVGYTPQERRTGVLHNLSLGENLVIASLDGTQSWYGLSKAKLHSAAMSSIEALAIVPRTPSTLLDILSGGNQQKAVLGRWLRLPLALLILDEPTQSIDIAAKADLMRAIRERTSQDGLAVLWLESDVEEVVKYADRILVMNDGSVTTELTEKPFDLSDVWSAVYGGEATTVDGFAR
jgi:ribose transport system ATP-binding protein